MMEPPLVSVVLPNRNHARYISRAIKALLGQTWPHLEILVVDDASTDDSREVVSQLFAGDARVQLLALDKHHGVSGAVQVGLTKARGEYIYIAAADDFVAPTFFERCVAEMTRFPTAGFCFSDPTEFREKDGQVVHFPLYLRDAPTYFDPEGLIALLCQNFFHMSANTGIYRLSAFRGAGGYIPELAWLSDWFVTIVIALRSGACYLPEQLTYVTMRDDSYSATNLCDTDKQRELVNRVVTLLSSPAYVDVAEPIHRAAILPEYHFRTLLWLLVTRQGRTFVSLRLVRRIAGRAIWSLLRPYAPIRMRRYIRKTAGVLAGSTKDEQS